MVSGQSAESLEQTRIAAVERRFQPLAGGGFIASAHHGDQRATGLGGPLEEFECEEPAEPAVRAGQQDGLRLAGHIGDPRGCGQRGFIDEFVEREVARTDHGGALPVHLANVGRVEPDSRSASM